MNAPLPATRLAGFYFAYYAVVGAFMPYWALWLQSRGHTPSEIGLVFAAMAATRLFMPVLWGWYADRRSTRMPVIQTACLTSLLIFVAIPLTQGLAWLLILSVAYNLFWNAILPQFEAATLGHLRESAHRYSRIRLWGSVGFIATVVAFGPLLDYTGIAPLPWLISLLFLLMVIAAFRVPEPAVMLHAGHTDVSIWIVLKRPEVIALLVACFLSQLSFAPFYSFFSLYIQQHGYTRGAIGGLWALGVGAEILVFLGMSRLLHRFGARNLMLLALATTALRWALLVMFVDHQSVLIFSQLLHLSSFAIYHAVSIHYIHRFFPGRLQGRGQALLNSVSFGAGGMLGSLGGGYLWEHGSPEAVYWTAAAVALLAWFIAWRGLRPAQGKGSSPLPAIA
jgi:PPP family 3-phenylpropionic acid transporter